MDDIEFCKQGFDFLADKWGKKQEQKYIPTMDEIYKTQWSSEFEQLMRNRLAMGYFRYGALNKQKKGDYDNIASIFKRLLMYERTGNLEYLVDCANICLVEFVNGAHPNKHFNAIDDGVHTEKK